MSTTAANNIGHTAQTKSQTSRKTFSPEVQKLSAAISDLITKDPTFKGMKLSTEIPRAREGEFNSRGIQKSYTPDLVIEDRSGYLFAIEVMGEGSGSDDWQRHSYLVSTGIHMMYFTNSEVNHALSLVLRFIRERIKMMRVLFP